jgi:hypothetical protein
MSRQRVPHEYVHTYTHNIHLMAMLIFGAYCPCRCPDTGSAGATAAALPATMYHVDHVAIVPNFRAQQAPTVHTATFECGQLGWYKYIGVLSRVGIVGQTCHVDVFECDCSLFHPHVFLIWCDGGRRCTVMPGV